MLAVAPSQPGIETMLYLSTYLGVLCSTRLVAPTLVPVVVAIAAT